MGPVPIQVPRDRDGTFTPSVVAKRQRRLGGIDNLVISLTAKGLTTGEVCAHLAEMYGTEVSKETTSTIPDGVLESLGEWQNRPLDLVYPVTFIDCINVKIRDGQVANQCGCVIPEGAGPCQASALTHQKGPRRRVRCLTEECPSGCARLGW